MKEYGLKGAYALYLTVLSNAEEDITAARLAELTHRDKADVSRAIAQFQAKGIVEAYGKNRYRAPIRLTDAGRELTALIREKATAALDSAGEGLSEDLRRDMYRALEIISTNLAEMSQDLQEQ